MTLRARPRGLQRRHGRIVCSSKTLSSPDVAAGALVSNQPRGAVFSGRRVAGFGGRPARRRRGGRESCAFWLLFLTLTDDTSTYRTVRRSLVNGLSRRNQCPRTQSPKRRHDVEASAAECPLLCEPAGVEHHNRRQEHQCSSRGTSTAKRQQRRRCSRRPSPAETTRARRRLARAMPRRCPTLLCSTHRLMPLLQSERTRRRSPRFGQRCSTRAAARAIATRAIKPA